MDALNRNKDDTFPRTIHERCFASKSETLLWLKPRLSKSRVLDLYFFTVQQWLQDAAGVLAAIQQKFPNQQVIIRSSSLSEDCRQNSNAGVYHSVSGIGTEQDCAVHTAVEKVIASYGNNPGDQILVQPQLTQAQMAGVVSSHALPNGQPYYVFSYETGGGTSGVTSGSAQTTTYYLYRNAAEACSKLPDSLKPVHAAVREIEALTGDTPIQLEFGCTTPEDVVIFQMRALPGVHSHATTANRQIRMELQKNLQQALAAKGDFSGIRTLLGGMPDWNPAELLGAHPRPLAISLYRALISSSPWCKARLQLGYKDIGSQDFLHVLAGRPYVNVRTSFSSFLPAGLPQKMELQLLGAWLDRLAAQPKYHDSIEFDVVPTCTDFNFFQDLQKNYGQLLRPQELTLYHEKLRLLTLRMLRRPVSGDLSLQRRYWDTSHGRHPSPDSSLLQDAIQVGSLPFARIARQAFAAESMLRSAVKRGALSRERLASFRRSTGSIGQQFLLDQNRLWQGELSEATFLDRYGHLRPNSFDICSPCYKEHCWNEPGAGNTADVDVQPFVLSSRECTDLNILIREQQFTGINAETFMAFARQAIAGREESKFLFSKFLSAILEQLAAAGAVAGLERETLSFLERKDIEPLLSRKPTKRAARLLRAKAEKNHLKFQRERQVMLPPLIRQAAEMDCFELPEFVPHFIGHTRVQADLVILKSGQAPPTPLTGKLVCIEYADPGFDWIFSRGIAGLITAYGGPNSHMAVRCAELGIPAAIGCGEALYQRISRGETLVLDCGQRNLYLAEKPKAARPAPGART
ncbi:PEP-utilizing enzyme [Thiolapillus sp.]